MENAKDKAPTNYRPLSEDALRINGSYGPWPFSIRLESHDKSVGLLRNCFQGDLNIDESHLLPSEMWGMARVVSSYLGRMNEAMAIITSWNILGSAKPGEFLEATSRVTGVKHVKGLPVATLKTLTESVNGIILEATDDILMLHGINRQIYQEGSEPPEDSSESPTMQGKFTVYDRMNWDPKIWINNIHTDWAKNFGYQEGLPEFATFMDLIYTFANPNQKIPTKIDVKRIWPFYVGEELDIKSYRIDETTQGVTFSKDGLLKLISEVTQQSNLQ